MNLLFFRQMIELKQSIRKGGRISMSYMDLHLHLDGAITPEIARRLADIQGIKLPDSDEELRKQLMVPDDCESLNECLMCFALPL